MGWVFVGVAGVLVFAIAALLVGSETFRLAHETPSAILDVDEAMRAVGDRLPVEVQARVSYAEVRRAILAALDHLAANGLSAAPGRDVRVIGERPEVVVADDETVASVLGALDQDGLEISDSDAHVIIAGLFDHLGRIGALGPLAE